MNSRAKPGQAYVPTDVEHIANVITHGIFVVPSVMGLLWMMYLAVDYLQIAIALVYGMALTALFTFSTTFHTISYTGKCSSMKYFFHIGDRAVIYIFIAASYTPWLALKPFHNGWFSMLTLLVVWIAAVFGIGYQFIFHEQYKWLETMFYITIGVLPSIVVLGVKDSTGIFWVALGGAVYISGVVFFKCDGVIPFAHAIWHCFVLAGALLHYYAVCKHLLGHASHSDDVAHPGHAYTVYLQDEF